MSVDWLKLVLRVIHIFSGIFWVGSTFFLSGFLGGAVKATAPEGGKVMQYILARTRCLFWISAASALTFLSGLVLYDQVSGGFQLAWIRTPAGIALSLGAVFGLLAFLHGFLTVGRANLRAAAIAKQLLAAGGPPRPEQAAELAQLQAKVAVNSRILAYILAIAVLGMAIQEAL